VYWRLGYSERESTQGIKISGKKLNWMVRSKERREAYIHEVGHVDTNHVELKPPGYFPTTIGPLVNPNRRILYLYALYYIRKIISFLD
jgi:hypothetical protein